WFRSPSAAGADPAALLPTAPPSVLRFKLAWKWDTVDQPSLAGLLRNYGAWCERNSAPGAASAGLYSTLLLGRQPFGALELTGVVTAGAEAQAMLDEFLATVTQGVAAPHSRETDSGSWLAFAQYPFADLV